MNGSGLQKQCNDSHNNIILILGKKTQERESRGRKRESERERERKREREREREVQIHTCTLCLYSTYFTLSGLNLLGSNVSGSSQMSGL